MKRRCPESKFIGIGVLKDWHWIITASGYANIIPSPGDIVYAIVYELSESDEESLDRYEGVPQSYVKEHFSILFTPTDGVGDEVKEVLVYVDYKRITEGEPKEEYIHRMNMGIGDALGVGIPNDYILKYLRPFIPVTKVDYESSCQTRPS